MEQQWTELKASARAELLDTLIAVMSMIDPAIVIEDYRDIGPDPVYGELLDESILNADKTKCSVSLYLPAGSEQAACAEEFIRSRFAALGVDAVLENTVHGQGEWENSWKKYYHVQHIGSVTILPAWEEYTPKDGEVLVTMDPGMAFGTGNHETTRLVIELLERHVKGGERLLDVGTGSGILAICGARLGAGMCRAYDIDPVAVKVARENIKDSGLKNITCDTSDLLHGVDKKDGGYDIICANIVADIIIRMVPDIGAYMNDGAVILASGIIVERADDVIKAFCDHGFYIAEKSEENGWCALAVKKN